MLDIFKWFFGIVGVIILAYVLVVTFRTVLSGGSNLVRDISAPSESTDSAFNSVNLSSLSLATWMQNFKPFTVAPINIVPAATQNIYEGVNGEYKNSWVYANGLDGNIESDFDDRWGEAGYFSNLDNSDVSNSDSIDYEREISVNLSPDSTIRNYQALYGYANSNVFKGRSFYVYVLDANSRKVGEGKMFKNGDQQSNGTYPFRGVIFYVTPNTPNGSITTSENKKIVDVNFYEYRSTVITKMPSIIFPSKTAR